MKDQIGLENCDQAEDAVAIADIGDRPSTIAFDRLAASASITACSAGSSSRSPAGGRRRGDDAIADFGADRAAAAGHHDRFPCTKLSSRPYRWARSSGAADPRRRSDAAPGAARSCHQPRPTRARSLVAIPSRRARANSVSARPPARHRSRQTRRATRVPRCSRSATTRSRSSSPPSTGTPRIACPRSAFEGRQYPDRPDVGDRSALDAAQQHLDIGRAAERQRRDRAALDGAQARAFVAELAIGKARADEKQKLEAPVERDGDLAEEESAVDLPATPGCNRAPTATPPGSSSPERCCRGRGPRRSAIWCRRYRRSNRRTRR